MKTIKFLLIAIATLSFVSCEQEGTPLSLDELYAANGISTSKFSASVRGADFETENASGIFVNNQLAITAQTDIRTLVIGVESLEAGTYLGVDNNLKNYINYSDSNSVVFTSTKQGEESDITIEIASYDSQSQQISGRFSGTLYDVVSDKKMKVLNGQFSKVDVDIPYFGEMRAKAGTIDFVGNSCTYTSSNSGGFVFETIASNANNDTLSLIITLDEKIQEKDYFFDRDPITGRYNSNIFSSDVFKNQYTSERGKMTVTSIDSVNQRIEGIFNFDAKNFLNEGILIRDGSFTAIIR